MACWDKTKVHVAGVPLSSVVDCRLVVPFGCDDVGVGGDVVGDGKAQLVLLPFGLASERKVSLACRMAPRLRLLVGVEARSPCSCSSRRRAS